MGKFSLRGERAAIAFILILAIAAAFSACTPSSKEDSPSGTDPISVNVNAPDPASLPASSGAVPENEMPALAIVKETMTILEKLVKEDIFPPTAWADAREAFLALRASRAFRSTTSSSNGPHVLDGDTGIRGTKVTGWMFSTMVASVSDDANPGTMAGDYVSKTFKDKVSIDFIGENGAAYTKNSIDLFGKHGIERAGSSTYTLTSYQAEGETRCEYSSTLEENFETAADTGLTATADDTGFKMRVTQTTRGTRKVSYHYRGPVNPTSWAVVEEEYIGNREIVYDTFSVAVSVYDNNNHRVYHKNFADYASWSEYFGD